MRNGLSNGGGLMNDLPEIPLRYPGMIHEPDELVDESYYQLMVRTEIDLAAFETWRRVTILQLALQAYRLDHGQLPESLDKLFFSNYLDEIPVDPYSDRPFVYFRQGIPKPNTELEAAEFEETQRLGFSYGNLFTANRKCVFETPCIWSPGPALRTYRRDYSLVGTNALNEAGETKVLDYYMLRDTIGMAWPYSDSAPLPSYAAWGRGLCFPIPERQ